MIKKDEALKLALENICSAKLCEFNSMSSRHEMIRLMDAAITAVREALAEQPAQQQKPVSLDDISLVCLPHAYPGAAAFAKGWNSALATLAERGPLYTSPPASKPWVGLTDEDVTWLCNTAKSHEQTWGMFARAIEAKLREKNT